MGKVVRHLNEREQEFIDYIKRKDISAVEKLLNDDENGIDIRLNNDMPIRTAVEIGDTEMVKFLYQHGADGKVA